ncbi:unnamed protein product [Pleuronectes platessa]|uniref:Uncharacterized protein n=1 Tax=Pleuronectes platessa TaxID=8262 RepID=A0A9N7YTM3_PLEPL|nr:unnamed protein product [Pleuronectes platessa]
MPSPSSLDLASTSTLAAKLPEADIDPVCRAPPLPPLPSSPVNDEELISRADGGQPYARSCISVKTNTKVLSDKGFSFVVLDKGGRAGEEFDQYTHSLPQFEQCQLNNLTDWASVDGFQRRSLITAERTSLSQDCLTLVQVCALLRDIPLVSAVIDAATDHSTLDDSP